MPHKPYRLRLGHMLLLLFLLPTVASGQDADLRASPFEQLRWVEGSPEVSIGSVWYRPVSIHGVDVDEVISFCEERWPGKMQKRFGEDLVEALQLMGHTVPAHVDLTLIRLSDGERVDLKGVRMSASNREAIWQANRTAGVDARPPARPAAKPPPVITRELALADIAEFQRRLDDQFAYRHWRGIDLAAELDALQTSLGEVVLTGDLAAALNRVLSRFGDGHAGASGAWRSWTRYSPFLLDEAGHGIVAINPDRTGFLDDARPYIHAIDGMPINEWIDAARPDITDGSSQLVRQRGLRAIRDIERIRTRLGLPESDVIRCQVGTGPSDPNPIEIEVHMTERRPRYGSWPRNDSGLIGDNIGYLRIERMDEDLVPRIHSTMAALRNTDGLVVDVRGNGGGSRALLIALAGYLLAPDEKPWVGNVAKYRQSDRFARDHLEARYMYRADDPRWSRAQRDAVTALSRDFEPEWAPGEGFSEWHYLVLDHTGHAAEYFYDKPVVILSDAACFSATDIFLGALAGRPRVTLMGTASGGGSARSQRFTLRNSQIEVRCASMASFRPDGRMYDGRGIEVDVVVIPKPGDLVHDRGDTVLDAAMRHILK